MGGAPEPVVRLPHGYTNATGKHAGVVHKTYHGPDPLRRRQVEYAALCGLRGRFPVPAVLPSSVDELRIEEVSGVHGQEVLDAGHAAAVLHLCGRTRRRLSEIDPTSVPGLPGSGPVIVHGDFGPQNLLLDEQVGEVVAVLDWELCRLGSPVQDLAWAEWIVRMHHPSALEQLGELFTGYGSCPAWAERKKAMLESCWRCREFCQRWGNPDAVRRWDKRIALTEAFQE